MGSLQVFGHRVSYITAGQAVKPAEQNVKENQEGCYSNRQARMCVGHSFTDSWIVSYVPIKSESVHRTHHLDTTSTYVPQTYQRHQPAASAKEYILTIPET